MSKADYITTIGLEIHAELKTRTKMFCNSKNDSDEKRPNVNICPVCMAHPGTLPVINKEAVRHILRIGVAVGGELADYTEFDRKNYFYPDIPKGYQISQYKYPLVSGGSLNGVLITRVHLEEDTARSIHEPNKSLVDFNRAGVPLMEMVTEPVIHSVEDAVFFARELQLLLRTLGAGEANMEKGEMRIEANISVSKNDERGVKVEVKNLNSFRSVERAIRYEINRQIEEIEKGGKVLQETMGWDEKKEVTFSQRLKEGSRDYRYFADPDLPKIILSKIPDFHKEAILKTLPELPSERRQRYASLPLKMEDIETLVQDKMIGDFFDLVVLGKEKEFAIRSANYITSDLIGLRVSKNIFTLGKITPESFREMIEMTFDGRLSSRGAKDILAVLFEEGGEVSLIAKAKNLIQESDPEAIEKIVDIVINKNPQVVSDYRAGKTSSIQFLIGQVIKETKGAGNPGVIRGVIEGKLE